MNRHPTSRNIHLKKPLANVITSIHLFVIHVIFSSFLVVQQEQEDEPPSNFDDLHCEIISAETRPKGHSHTVDQNQQLAHFAAIRRVFWKAKISLADSMPMDNRS